MMAVFRRELASYYKGVTGWLLAAFLLIFAGIYCMAYNLSGYYANFAYVLSSMTFIYLIAVPVISMRSLAEEKRQKTDQLLYSLPIRLSSVAGGKYLAMLVALAFPLCIMAVYPLILRQWGDAPMKQAYGALIGFFLLGAALLAIGLFISSMMESQLAAAIVTLVVMLLLFFMSALSSYVSTDAWSSFVALAVVILLLAAALQMMAKNWIVTLLAAALALGGLYIWYLNDSVAFAGLFGEIMESISVFDRYDNFTEGVFDWTSVVYFLSVIGVFLFLTVQSMEKRRWSE